MKEVVDERLHLVRCIAFSGLHKVHEVHRVAEGEACGLCGSRIQEGVLLDGDIRGTICKVDIATITGHLEDGRLVEGTGGAAQVCVHVWRARAFCSGAADVDTGVVHVGSDAPDVQHRIDFRNCRHIAEARTPVNNTPRCVHGTARDRPWETPLAPCDAEETARVDPEDRGRICLARSVDDVDKAVDIHLKLSGTVSTGPHVQVVVPAI
eukprot:2378016-Prymnesium_polylepis.2